MAEQHVGDDAPALETGRERLRQFIWFDVISVVSAEVVMGAAYVFVEPSGWFLVLGLLVGGSGGVMAMGLRPLRRGDLEGAVRWLAAANWLIAVAVAVIATFAWPILMLAALLPAVLAPPYVPGGRLRWYLMISVAVTVFVAAVGLLQDVTGFEDQLPEWVSRGVVVAFTPFMAWLVVQIAFQNRARLQAAFDDMVAANERLRRSEQGLAEQARALQESRVRLVAAGDRERRRVERDLHDGAQQRLVALGVRLRVAQDLCRRDPERAAVAIAALRDEIHHAQSELRELAHGVYPPVLTQHGLAEALRGAADRSPIPVDVCADGCGRYPPEVEAAVYFCCAEALQNAAKHAGADARVTVTIAQDGEELRFSVADDGVGFADGARAAGTGFDNLRERLGAAGGGLVVESASGQGTTVAGRVPAVARPARPQPDSSPAASV